MNANQAPWRVLRAGISAVDNPLITTTTGNWDARPLTKGQPIPHGALALFLAVIGDHVTDPEDSTVTIKFTAFRQGGPAQVIGTYVFTIGGQKVTLHPAASPATASTTMKYAENIAESGVPYWIADPQIVGNLADNMACIALKTYGAAFIAAEVTAIDAGLTVDVIMSPVDNLP